MTSRVFINEQKSGAGQRDGLGVQEWAGIFRNSTISSTAYKPVSDLRNCFTG